MKNGSVPVYIRFGNIPSNGKSKIYRNGEVVGEEIGVSVFRAVEAFGMYFPVMPKDANPECVFDYFKFLLHSELPVFLVTGTELCYEGHDREPLLTDVIKLKDITSYYRDKTQIW